MKKLVLKVEIHDDKAKQKAMKAVSGLSGVESVSADMKDKKLSMIGETDPVPVVAKLRKLCHTEILSVGPAKEEKKKEETKEEQKKPEEVVEWKPYEVYGYYQTIPSQYYYVMPVEEHPCGCVIC